MSGQVALGPEHSGQRRAELAFLEGGGETGALIRDYDWSTTSLGPIAAWPQSLKTITGMLLLSPVPIVLLWGPEGIMIYNDAYSGFAGGRHPRLLGSEVRKGWLEVADFNDNVMKVGLAGRTLAYKDQELTLYRHGRPEQVWMNLDYSPVFDESGRPAGVIAVVVETTERVRAEAQLRENESRLRFLDSLSRETAKSADADAILETTTQMVGEHLGVSVCAYADMDSDEDGFTIRGNWTAPGSPDIRGHYSLADFGRLAMRNLHAGLPLIVNDNRKELALEEALAFQRIGISATICMPLVKEGHLTALMAIHDRAPRTWTVRELALLSEVTERSWAHIERVRSEAESRRAEQRFREELEVQVAERTAALQRSELALLQAQKMEAIGRLTGGIAHDFNNLLMAILGSLDLLRRRLPDDAALLRLVDNALEGARRGSGLTSRMLAFARKQELKPERVDLAELVGGMTELLQRSLGPTIDVETKFQAQLPPVEIDPNQFEAALLNLAVNARDAMRGEGRIVFAGRVETLDERRHGLRPGRYVCFAVTDDGEGMDEATLKRAMEPFFTTKGVGKGTGLGLSMVHGFAEQSGGTLVLSSAPGRGTTATLWLPASAARTDARSTEDAPPEPPAPVADQPAEPVTLRILAVDDDPLVLLSTVAMLEDLGHRVSSAPSGKVALELLAVRRYDLVITDHAMPQMTGIQFAARAREHHPDLPILLATGYVDLPAGTQSGLPRLQKPFSQDDLAAALGRVLAG